MKTLQISRISHGKETGEMCEANTLKNAFKKAKIRDWTDYRITQYISDKKLIIFDTSYKNFEGYF